MDCAAELAFDNRSRCAFSGIPSLMLDAPFSCTWPTGRMDDWPQSQAMALTAFVSSANSESNDIQKSRFDEAFSASD